MIFPRNEFLILFIILGIPGAALIGAPSQLVAVGVTLSIMFILLVLIDTLLSWNLPSNVAISLAPSYRLTSSIESFITLDIACEKKHLNLCLGLMLPEEITTHFYTKNLHFTPDNSRLKIEWPCTPVQRGLFKITMCKIDVVSTLRLFMVRKSIQCSSEIRVYPDLRKEYQQLAGFFLNRGIEGNHAWKMVGKGREFEKLREYVHGDSYDDIHWKTTAKRGRPVTKVFQIERTQHLYVILDKSRWSVSPITVTNKKGQTEEVERTTFLEKYISASLVLASAAQRQGDCYGLLSFSNHCDSFVKASRGPSHYNLFRDTVYDLNAHDVNPDYHEVIAHIRLNIRRRSLILFLVNLDEPVLAEEFLQSISLISKKHLVLVGVLLENHHKPLFSEKIEEQDQIFEHLENHLSWNNLHQIERQLKSYGIQMIRFNAKHICKQLVSTYVHIKQRQLI